MSAQRSPFPQMWLVYFSKVRPIARPGKSDICKEALPNSLPPSLRHHLSPQPQAPEVQQFPWGMYELGLEPALTVNLSQGLGRPCLLFSIPWWVWGSLESRR